MVLFVSYAGVLGGAERLLIDCAAGCERECALACPPGPLADAAAAAGLRVLALRARDLSLRARNPLRALADLAGHARELRALSRALAPELVVAWSMRPLLAAITLRGAAGAPVAFQHNDFLPGRALGALIRRAAVRADLITTPSQAVADELALGHAARRRTVVVAPGVDLDRFAPGAPPVSPPELLVLGAIAPWKRPELALEALALVRRAEPGARLVLAGAPLPGDAAGAALLQALHQRARRPDLAGAVTIGAVPDPAAALARCTLLLHCAPREPFGLAVAEALAAGRPAVVPDAAGPAEIVAEGCGRRYAPEDPGAAAAAIEAILADPAGAQQMGARGRARAQARYARATQQAAYRDALASVLGHPTASRQRRIAALAVVTVTHNSAGHLRALLASVDRHLPGARVVVADCASADDTVAVARARAHTTVLTLPNLGFGAATNRGLDAVGEPVAVLINPDVELIDDSLLELVAQLQDPGGERWLLAPRVLNADGSLQDTVHPPPLSRADVARTLLPPAALPGRLGVALAPWRSTRPRRVGWAVGCALAGATATLRGLGPFDERIFLYGEDMELGLRAAREGIETWLWPQARVVHHGGHAIEAVHGGEAFALRAQARHDALALALGPRRARLDDAAQALTFAGRLALKRALWRPAERERRQLRAVRGIRAEASSDRPHT